MNIPDKTKRITTISVLAIIVILMILGVIRIFTKDESTTSSGSGDVTGFLPTGVDVDISGDSGFVPTGLPGDVLGIAGDLKQLVMNSVSGVAFATNSSDISSSTVRYIEKSTGHIYEIDIDTRKKQRISNTTILKIFESFWADDGDSVVIRYAEENGRFPSVRTFLSSFSGNGIDGVFLSGQISAITVSALETGESKIFYTQKDGDNWTGIIADLEDKNKSSLFSLPFGEFNTSWPSKNVIALTTKPTSQVEGMLFFVNPSTGSLQKILSKIKGLTTLVSPDAEKIIYSQSYQEGISTHIYDISSKKAQNLGVTTFPEKCIWSNKNQSIVYCGVPSLLVGKQPDDWYQGKISFGDALWKINVRTGATIRMKESIGLDVINLILTPNEDFLIFGDKKDGSLWSLQLLD